MGRLLNFFKGRRRKYIPKYYGLRIYLISTLLYFFLVMPIVGILFIKYGPDIESLNPNSERPIRISSDSLISNNREILLIDSTNLATLPIEDSTLIRTDSLNRNLADGENSTVSTENISENKIRDTIMVLLKLLLLSFLIGFAYNLPFKLYFKKKRRGKPIPEKLFKYCKKFLTKTPAINGLILLFAYGTSIAYMLYMLIFFKGFDEITSRLYVQFFFISILATILTVVFVFYWQRHRVQLKYLEYVFTEDELKRRVFDVKVGKIKTRMWVSSGMTTLLPLIIVIFYLFLSSTRIRELGIDELSEGQIQILFGKYIGFFGSGDFNTENSNGFFFVNAIDTTLMFVGIFTGIFTSLIYILIFIRWTTMDIIRPVKELLANMQLTGQGELDQYSIVRTNDEIGELTEGFNEMSEKIKDYILSISRINQANSRFVPRQFIEFLGKDNIADVSLGDQVQKEMTILFSDIREFTSISEDMTPKENFDFLNNYLGYMEPVIRTNRGFIDKFMGDSIMALFSEKPEDAINAAIEMRIKLAEFNQVLRQFGKPPIDSGIGLHTGSLMLGIVGGEGRMDSTVISDSVNLAARLEGLTKIYGSAIIISEDTLIKLNDPSQYNYRFIDIVKVKGKKEAVYIFEILDGEPSKVRELKIQTKIEFGTALQHYKNKEFKKAFPLFKEVSTLNKFDKASEMYMNRCDDFIKNGVPDNWDGIEIITGK